MEILIILALIVLGLFLFGIEVFMIPGITIAGVASAASMIYAIYRGFSELGITAGFLTMGGCLAGIAVLTLWFMRSRTIDRLSLKKAIDYSPRRMNDLGIHKGDHGITLTRLTLIGRAEINGCNIEVQSADGFIDEQTPIEVSHVSESVIYVQKA